MEFSAVFFPWIRQLTCRIKQLPCPVQVKGSGLLKFKKRDLELIAPTSEPNPLDLFITLKFSGEDGRPVPGVSLSLATSSRCKVLHEIET